MHEFRSKGCSSLSLQNSLVDCFVGGWGKSALPLLDKIARAYATRCRVNFKLGIARFYATLNGCLMRSVARRTLLANALAEEGLAR
jgi:hypothetical protein